MRLYPVETCSDMVKKWLLVEVVEPVIERRYQLEDPSFVGVRSFNGSGLVTRGATLARDFRVPNRRWYRKRLS